MKKRAQKLPDTFRIEHNNLVIFLKALWGQSHGDILDSQIHGRGGTAVLPGAGLPCELKGWNTSLGSMSYRKGFTGCTSPTVSSADLAFSNEQPNGLLQWPWDLCVKVRSKKISPYKTCSEKLNFKWVFPSAVGLIKADFSQFCTL